MVLPVGEVKSKTSQKAIHRQPGSILATAGADKAIETAQPANDAAKARVARPTHRPTASSSLVMSRWCMIATTAKTGMAMAAMISAATTASPTEPVAPPGA